MKNLKYYLLATGIITITIYLLFFNKKTKKQKPMPDNLYKIIPSKNGLQNFTPPTEQDIKIALKKIEKEFGTEIAQLVEKMYRYETAHFKSSVFLKTNGAGVIVTPSTEKYFTHRDKLVVYVKPVFKNGQFVRNAVVPEGTEGAKKYTYVIFPTIYDGMRYLAIYIQKYGDKAPEKWSGGAYDINRINKLITTKYV